MKKPQTTAIAKRPDPVGAICKAMVPPPKKRDILIATATVIYQKQLEALKQFEEGRVAERKQLIAEITKEVDRNIKTLRHEVNIPWQWRNGTPPQDQHVEVKVFLPEELTRRISAHQSKSRPHTQRLEEILKELRAKSDNQGATVQALLSDPSIKSKLLTLGESLLNGLTASDKASAIVVD